MPCSFLGIFIYFNCYAGLEFYSEFVLIDSDLFNQPPDKRLVVFGQGSGLLLQKCAHVGDTFLQFIPAEILELSLLLFITQAIVEFKSGIEIEINE